MKKSALVLSAVAAFATPAFAADLPARIYSKAPAMAVTVTNWTGCYVGGGGGYGMWNQENSTSGFGPPPIPISDTITTGGRGYFGTVQVGCDYQFAAAGGNFVVGAFGDYDFASLKGTLAPSGASMVGEETMSSAWAVGGRLGWLVSPSFLTYFSAGYTEATFDGTDFRRNFPPFGVSANRFQDKQTYKGWFIGAGNEYALDILPGLFWKNEYRFSEFDVATNPLRNTVTGVSNTAEDSKKFLHTVRSELVYRFNWGGSAPTKAYAQAPASPAPVVNWTGCYVGGGGGYGLWNQENTTYDDGPPRTRFSESATTGGRGYLGTVQGGCDYQLAAAGARFVVGAFGDYDFSSLKGNLNPQRVNGVGDEKMSSAWSAGGRLGWLALPNLLTYVSVGYTEATFDRTDFTGISAPFGVPAGLFTDKRTYKGWFIGAGDEYALNFLPGLFWKNEYRFSEFDVATNPIRITATGLPTGVSIDSEKYTHTVRSQLVYRFNWGGGAVVAKY
ncbi:autotransporter domain-containing protein [Bradyrhizobium sp. AUGA SZCCT0222]|uniref:outer membrane protein n=1 Tax=Bradyrhizobium sp. AUGA SZCCT0222 TaxID=2807668 RepID=UPI001BAC6194|nr:autotransporter domain-containing protein [Bradyrhizobium sp. AUGA SZCCT0222]MBR1272499.1 autotransporter domain-containing protein [Bradyrhizobium sp. AUGA SZCCT0222]